MDSGHLHEGRTAPESTESSIHCVGHDTERRTGLNTDSAVSDYCMSAILQPDQELTETPSRALPLVELDNTVSLQDNTVFKKNGVESETVTVARTKEVRQRYWTVILSAIVACIPFLLVGCTLGFPSGALLDLTDLEARPDYKLSRELEDIFGVRNLYEGSLYNRTLAGIQRTKFIYRTFIH